MTNEEAKKELYLDITIKHWLHFDNRHLLKDGKHVVEDGIANIKAEELYRVLGYNYIKFFKMDILCKWAWLGAEKLLTSDNSFAYDGVDKKNVAVVLMTSNGCIDVDKKYIESTKTIASPALFVYTLSNIMLGEISIRHGFKGEQTCLVSSQFDASELEFWVGDLLESRGMDACICGWVDAYDEQKDVCMFYVEKSEEGIEFSEEQLNKLYNKK